MSNKLGASSIAWKNIYQEFTTLDEVQAKAIFKKENEKKTVGLDKNSNIAQPIPEIFLGKVASFETPTKDFEFKATEKLEIKEKLKEWWSAAELKR